MYNLHKNNVFLDNDPIKYNKTGPILVIGELGDAATTTAAGADKTLVILLVTVEAAGKDDTEFDTGDTALATRGTGLAGFLPPVSAAMARI